MLEVLVASVIMISSIAAITLVYRTNFVAAEQAEKHVSIAGIVKLALNQIQQTIRAKSADNPTQLQGANTFWGVEVSWQARQVEIGHAPAVYDFDLGKEVEPPNKYKLWKVDVQFTKQGTTQEYSYHEVSWNEY